MSLLYACTADNPARGPVAAASVAVSLSGVSAAAVRTAPLVAAGWAEEVAAAARRSGTVVRAEPLVTADLVGVTVEALEEDRAVLCDLPDRLAAAVPDWADPARLARWRAGALSRAERHVDRVRRALFGTAHRYGLLEAERAAHLRSVGGDVVTAAARELLGAERSPQCPPRREPWARRETEIGGGRAFYLLGTAGVALGSAEKAALHVAWALLGDREGLLDARLRKTLGLTYSLAAFSRELAEGGYGVCFTGCELAHLEAVAATVAEVLDGLVRDPVAPSVLVAAKERLTVRWHQATASGRGWTRRLVGYLAAGLDRAELLRYPQLVDAVGGAEVRAVAAAMLTPGAGLEIRLLPGQARPSADARSTASRRLCAPNFDSR